MGREPHQYGFRDHALRAAALETLRLLPRAAGVLPRAALSLPPVLRRRLLVLALVAGALAGGYFGWLRDSSLVRVERVKVEGLSGPGSERVRAALADSARGMTTLHIRQDELERAVESEPLVHSITVHTDFPRAVRIAVVQKTPVGVLVVRGRRVPVAADGTLLRDSRADRLLPTLPAGKLPRGKRLGTGHAMRLVQVAAAAPAALRRRIEGVRQSRAHGYVAQVRGGPDVWIGDTSALDAKWRAAAAILAQASSEGADYIDVRFPERAVAGGLEQGAVSADEQQAGAGEPALPASPDAAAGTPSPAPAAPAPQPIPEQAPAQPVAPSQQHQP